MKSKKLLSLQNSYYIRWSFPLYTIILYGGIHIVYVNASILFHSVRNIFRINNMWYKKERTLIRYIHKTLQRVFIKVHLRFIDF